MPDTDIDLSDEITHLTAERVRFKPVIAEICRTRYCAPGSHFLVEGIDTIFTSKSKPWRAIRLLLGDGELCIQALLAPDMHRYVDQREVFFGTYIRIERFRLDCQAVEAERETHDTAHPDQLMYLVVEDLQVIGWNNGLIDTGEESDPVTEEEGGTPMCAANKAEEDRTEEAADADDGFEVMPSTGEKVAQRRAEIAIRSSDQQQRPRTASSQPPDAKPRPWLSTDPTQPLKLTNLRGIPYLPYKQNWAVHVLAVVSSITDVEPSGLPPYGTQRQARLTDPSTSKHVLLTVFLNPEQFAPRVGSVVLLLSVKNHRFDGGSLKKYASDRPEAGGRWWYENPLELDWCDVEGLQKWWRESHETETMS